jgi:hypothetical protein
LCPILGAPGLGNNEQATLDTVETFQPRVGECAGRSDDEDVRARH